MRAIVPRLLRVGLACRRGFEGSLQGIGDRVIREEQRCDPGKSAKSGCPPGMTVSPYQRGAIGRDQDHAQSHWQQNAVQSSDRNQEASR